MNYYDLDGIQTEIKKQIERTKCLIEKMGESYISNQKRWCTIQKYVKEF